jgi:hypothetical protein
MKRTQLAVGAELAYQRRTNDTDSTFGIDKVIVLAVEPHEQARYDRTARKVESGNGVLVSVVARHFSNEMRTVTKVVQLSTLVGDYQAEVARREAAQAAETKRREERAAQQAAYSAEFNPALNAMISEMRKVSTKHVGDYMVLRELPLEVVNTITAALAAQNAKVA